MTREQTTNPVMIPLDRLRADEAYQPRLGGLDERHVRLLLSTDLTQWPPLLVAPNDDGSFDVIDGFHRLEAGRRRGVPALPCVVDPTAGYAAAVAANLRHGLPLSLTDRKAFARWLHEQEPALSYRELGRQTGLNHETVKKALEEGEPSEGRDGEHRRAKPDPIDQLVRQVERTYFAGSGRTWFGFGTAGNPTPFRRALEDYREEDRAAVAQALDAFGRACVAAAEPYLEDGDR